MPAQITPRIKPRLRPTSITISETTSPNSTPAPIGVAPVNSYSPRITAPSAHAAAAHTKPRIGLIHTQATLPPVPDPVDLSATRVRTDDWPAQATESIVKVVGTASDKVTGPITTAARAIVYGLFAGILGVAALVLV